MFSLDQLYDLRGLLGKFTDTHMPTLKNFISFLHFMVKKWLLQLLIILIVHPNIMCSGHEPWKSLYSHICSSGGSCYKTTCIYKNVNTRVPILVY